MWGVLYPFVLPGIVHVFVRHAVVFVVEVFAAEVIVN